MYRQNKNSDEAVQFGEAARRRKSFAGLVCAAVALMAGAGACAAEYQATKYGIGDKIYVRALALDEARDSLWVGTSTGVLEIDLNSIDLKNTFTRDDGLANEYVFGIGVAPTGEVWFGTNAGGASTYKDGEWRTYFPMHGLADYWVYAFDFDRDQNVWIGTWEGANKFDPATGKFVTYRDELINIWVYGIDIDDKGAVWFGTEGGVSMLKDGVWTSWTHKDGLGAPDTSGLPPSPNTGLGTRSRHDLNVTLDGEQTYNPNYVFAVKVDALGRGVWFGTWGGGVALFDGESKWLNYTVDDGLAGNLVYSIAQDASGVMWFGTNQGISSFDGENWETYRDGLPGRHYYSIVAEPNGVIWAATKGAVVKLSPDSAGE